MPMNYLPPILAMVVAQVVLFAAEASSQQS